MCYFLRGNVKLVPERREVDYQLLVLSDFVVLIVIDAVNGASYGCSGWICKERFLACSLSF